MTLRIITPPTPIVVPADIAGDHAADDAKVAAAIAAVTEQIDGPTGWLGRALGPQTLEWATWLGCERLRLPCPPIIQIVSVTTEDSAGNSETADPATYRRDGDEIVVSTGAAWVRRYRHRVRYQAGYNGTPVSDGGTGPIPERVKQAIIVMVQDLVSAKAENLFLRSEEVDGVGTTQYTVSDQAGAVIQRAADRLLAGLRVYA